VLGRDSRAFLAVVRSLGRGGLEVHAASSSIDSAPRRSRFLHHVHDMPPYGGGDSAWAASLARLLERERFDLVIPCTDAAMAALQIHRRDLEPHGGLFLLADGTYERLTDKSLATAAASAAGIPVPRGVAVADGAAPPPPFGWPLVLKPCTSYDRASPARRQVVRKVYREEEYARALVETLRGGPLLVQENVPGRGVGVELLLRDGEPLLIFQHVRVHEPLMGGGSSYRRSVPVSPELLDASLALLRPLAYTGVAMVEFKVDEASGRFFFMEVNPRFWGSLPLALAAGVDFPLALYRLLVEGRGPARPRYRSPLFCRNLTLDLEWQRANLRADPSDATLATRPRRLVLRDALINTVTLRERIDTFTLDDPAPAFAEARQILDRLASRLRRALATIVWRRPLVRRWLARRARCAAREARSILFACKGNLCRSPFAAALAQRTGRFENVGSAGYHPVEGRRPPGHAIGAAAPFGVDLETHRSRRLTEAAVRDADAIFVFDRENYARIVSDFPEARGRVHVLGVLHPPGPMFIEDPWSGDFDRFRRVYGEIGAAIRAMADARGAPGRMDGRSVAAPERGRLT
jgi:protein-tyrosine-phosphatase/predicted ATP-grasp superfamily ATP-dependent carboligase